MRFFPWRTPRCPSHACCLCFSAYVNRCCIRSYTFERLENADTALISTLLKQVLVTLAKYPERSPAVAETCSTQIDAVQEMVVERFKGTEVRMQVASGLLRKGILDSLYFLPMSGAERVDKCVCLRPLSVSLRPRLVRNFIAHATLSNYVEVAQSFFLHFFRPRFSSHLFVRGAECETRVSTAHVHVLTWPAAVRDQIS